MKTLIYILTAIFFITACNENHTVNDFMKDENLYLLFLQRCNNGELHKQDINCQNVYEAKHEKQKNIWRESREKSEKNGAKL